MNDDRPTLPAWAVAAICELTEQIERLASGYACRECLGSKETKHVGKVGGYVRDCFACKGTGLKSK